MRHIYGLFLNIKWHKGAAQNRPQQRRVPPTRETSDWDVIKGEKAAELPRFEDGVSNPDFRFMKKPQEYIYI